MKKLVILILIVLVALTACSRQKIRPGLSTEQKMNLANEYYERNNYRKAIDYYSNVVFERRSVHTPLAQFRLAESYFQIERYEDAIFEYRELIRLFPDFRMNNIAYFRIGEALFNQSRNPHYSQQETKAAIEAFSIFIDRFPLDEKYQEAVRYIAEAEYKLLEKKYYNGYIYYKLYDYSSALMYFAEVLAENNRDEIDRMSRYYSALIYLERKDRDNAYPIVDSLKEYYPGSRETNRVVRLFERTF
jgi:outer membrane protein assembly factor BamD